MHFKGRGQQDKTCAWQVQEQDCWKDVQYQMQSILEIPRISRRGEGIHRANLLNCGEWRSGYFLDPYTKSAHREEMDERLFSHETLTASN